MCVRACVRVYTYVYYTFVFATLLCIHTMHIFMAWFSRFYSKKKSQHNPKHDGGTATHTFSCSLHYRRTAYPSSCDPLLGSVPN